MQEACGRIGAVTGKGLAGIIKDHYNRTVLIGAVILVVIANTINLGADIGAVAAAAQLVVYLPALVYCAITAILICLLEVFISYKSYARMLKWLSLALISYPVTALIVHEPWGQIIQATLVPHIQLSFAFLFIITGVFGTTISPYMFFWQTSGEVEEEIALNILSGDGGRPHLTRRFLRDLRIDTAVGMIASEVAQWFIIITTATVLYSHGVLTINTAADAAKALQPLVKSFPDSGQVAKDLFAVGVIGLGFLGIPVLAGSAAYALSEAMGWREGLYRKFSQAKGFYGVIIVSTLIGLAINFSGINPIKALVFTAVFNGVAAVPLVYLIARINSSHKIMGRHRGGRLSRSLIWLTFVIMALAAVAMFATLIFR